MWLYKNVRGQMFRDAHMYVCIWCTVLPYLEREKGNYLTEMWKVIERQQVLILRREMISQFNYSHIHCSPIVPLVKYFVNHINAHYIIRHYMYMYVHVRHLSFWSVIFHPLLWQHWVEWQSPYNSPFPLSLSLKYLLYLMSSFIYQVTRSWHW